MRYKCPQCGNIWTEGDWCDYPSERFCSDGCRRAYDDAHTSRTKCHWCGNLYVSGSGIKDSADNHYCSNKCYNEAMKDPSIAAEVEEAEARERRQREEEARRRKAEAERKAREEAAERARKADPNRWYPQEWIDHLKTNPGSASRCPWSRLTIKASMWSELFKVQPALWDKCNCWDDFRVKNWRECLDALLKQSGFKSGIERRMNGPGWAVLLAKTRDYDSCCDWSELDSRDWGELLRYRPEFGVTCPCWDEFDAADWCTILANNPKFWLKAWRCNWFDADDSDWSELPVYTIPFQVFMFVAGKINRFLNGVGGLFVLAAVVLIIIAFVL